MMRIGKGPRLLLAGLFLSGTNLGRIVIRF
jgi:hypothetical protein